MKSTIMPTQDGHIKIKGARLHNLKNVSLSIVRNKLVVVTGVSGSGKSTLAFDTIYAEGQRRYVESLSSYARQFLGKINKPEVDYIQGIPPAIAIEQKVNTRNPRSTVGTSTEIYDYLKLLYTRIGKTYSPKSGEIVKKHSIEDVIEFIRTLPENSKVLIIAPYKIDHHTKPEDIISSLFNQGFNRIEINNETYKLEDISIEDIKDKDELNLVIDRLKSSGTRDTINRIAESTEQAFAEGNGYCKLLYETNTKWEYKIFSNKFESDGIQFEEPSVHMFTFNNPVGACPRCEGYGSTIGIDEDLVIPNKSLSVYDDAIVCWKGEKMSKWKNRLIYSADKFNFPIHRPINELSDDEFNLLWTGNKYFKGLNTFFNHLERKKYKIQYRVMLSRYRGKTTCPECNGTRLKREASFVKVGNKSIQYLVSISIRQLKDFFDNLKLSGYEHKITKRLLVEITSRIDYLIHVGLEYLTLNRLSSTLSGGESQRINLATSLGSSLIGSLYILDEPSIGLHPRDTQRLIKVLRNLQNIGNSVIVVEHDEEIIRSADEIIDIGPGAGRNGGEIVFQGSYKTLKKEKESLTARYINKDLKIKIPESRRKWNHYIELKGVRENNLKNLTVKFPLHTISCITGVSGSGKSSLVKNVLYAVLSKRINGIGEKTGKYDDIAGDIHLLQDVQMVDQNPIGKSSRSNPVTYIKAYDEIRKLFANQHISKMNGYKPSHFSFNIDGGRCDECQGEGTIKVEMQFMADIELTCENCNGKRFKSEILEVRYRDKNIYEILDMTINQAIEFFMEDHNSTAKKVAEKLKPLQDVGLGYVKLGQSSSTLSGGESQRVKLAYFLSKENSGKNTLFIFDEPTTGLHFHDINKLLDAFNRLIEKGNSIIIIEHNMDIIKSADWIIDLGPEGGNNGGEIIFEGTPEGLTQFHESYTGKYLSKKIQ